MALLVLKWTDFDDVGDDADVDRDWKDDEKVDGATYDAAGCDDDGNSGHHGDFDGVLSMVFSWWWVGLQR